MNSYLYNNDDICDFNDEWELRNVMSKCLFIRVPNKKDKDDRKCIVQRDIGTRISLSSTSNKKL